MFTVADSDFFRRVWTKSAYAMGYDKRPQGFSLIGT
jgi:hypothetical protein